jgi:AAA15 family ATPase/GTPase
MLYKIKISNFKSIINTELDLSYTDKKAPNGYKDSEELYFLEPTNNTKNRLSTIMCLYGANASGKSNIIKAILVLKSIMNAGIRNNLNNMLQPFHNKINVSDNGSKIELEFFSQQQRYKYVLEFTTNKILHEKLVCNENVLFEIKNSKIIDISIQSEVNNNQFLEKLLFESLDKNNQVHTFLKLIYDRLPNLNDYMSCAINFFNNISIGDNNHIQPDTALKILANSSNDTKISESLDKISNILQKLDIDICKLEFRKKLLPKGIVFGTVQLEEKDMFEYYDIITTHKNYDGVDVKFLLTEESTGTQLLFGIIAIMLATLEKGGVMIIDELDKSLHPVITKVILEMFKSKEYNKYGSQLITTLHTTDVLEHYLRTYEASFVNKSLKKGTTINRLSKYESRQEINFRDRYIAGMYRAKPNTQI